MARIQPLLLDGILAANTLPGHFEFARTRTAQAAEGMIDLHWTYVPGTARYELWTRRARCHYSDNTAVSGGLAGVAGTGVTRGRRQVHPKCVDPAHFTGGTP